MTLIYSSWMHFSDGSLKHAVSMGLGLLRHSVEEQREVTLETWPDPFPTWQKGEKNKPKKLSTPAVSIALSG